jgi:serine protease Do
VAPGSPAAGAGIERGDVIVRFGEQAIARPRDLSRVVARAPIGQAANLELLRRGARQTLSVTIREMVEPRAAAEAPRRGAGGELAGLGLRASDLTAELRQELGVEGEGAVLEAVDPDGPAERAGLRKGDVVVEVDREPVRSAAELEARLRAGGESLLLLVRRGDGALYVVLRRERG